MQLTELEEVAVKLMGELPAPVITALEDVEMMVCETPADAAAELRAELGADFTAEDAAEVSATGCKGVFVGTPTEVEDSDESEEEEIVFYPEGFVVLCAVNIESADEAKVVLMHEIGHALGMSEDEVTQLGLGIQPAPTEGDSNGSTASSDG